MRNLVRSLIGGAALLAAAPALAQTAPAQADLNARLELAREVFQLCGQGSYFERRMLDQAARLSFEGSAEAARIKDERYPGEARNALRTARIEAARALGCGEAAGPVIKEGSDWAYLELASLLLVLQSQVNAKQTELTPEGHQLYKLGVAQLEKAYPGQLQQISATALQLAAQRQQARGLAPVEQGIAANLYRDEIDALLADLRFQVVMLKAGMQPVLRFDRHDTGSQETGSRLAERIELLPTATAPAYRQQARWRVLGSPRDIFVPGNIAGHAGAMLVRDRSGAMMVMVYGEDARTLPRSEAAAKLVVKGSALPLTVENVWTTSECSGFEICLRFAPEADAMLEANTDWQVAQLRLTLTNDSRSAIPIEFDRAQWNWARGQ